jgi:hypothetical protein
LRRFVRNGQAKREAGCSFFDAALRNKREMPQYCGKNAANRAPFGELRQGPPKALARSDAEA